MQEKRQDIRRPTAIRATIGVPGGGPELPCEVLDISDHGARLILAEPADLADDFILFLSQQGRVRRQCRVAWRNGQEVGVSFPGREERSVRRQ